jgi:sulfur carrier protein ThiS
LLEVLTEKTEKIAYLLPLTTSEVLCYEFAMQVEWEGKIQVVDKRLTAQRLLEMLALSREAHLVTANGALVTEDHMLEKDDRVRIIRVISGG